MRLAASEFRGGRLGGSRRGFSLFADEGLLRALT